MKQKQLKQNSRLIFAAIIGFVIAMIAVVIVIYSLFVTATVENTTLNNIAELAAHDKNTISTFINYNWRNLERVSKRLNRRPSCDKINDLFDYLDDEVSETPFDDLFLITEDYSYYSSITYMENPGNRENLEYPEGFFYDFKALFKDSEAGTSLVTFDKLQNRTNDDNVVIYGHKLETPVTNPYVNGKSITALVGVHISDSLEAGLVINSFADERGNYRGFSSIITTGGDYIVNINASDDASTGTGKPDNILDHFAECEKSDFTLAEIEEKMKGDKSFWFYHEDGGVRELHYCIPMISDNIDWIFLLTVNAEALTEQTNSFVGMIVIALGITLIILISAAIIIIFSQNKTAKALAQEKAQSEFLSNMSHEIRTPLNGLVGLNYLIMTSIDDESKKEQIKEWLAKSHSTANYLLSLINDVLDISKLRAGKVEIIREPLLIETVVDAIHSMMHSTIESRGIEFITDFKITVPCILGDEVHIKQVLMNIVGNASKFTPAGGFIKFSLYQNKTDDKHVTTTFICEDSGCGMSKEFTTKIFDAFTQDRNSNSSSIKGTGLGMAICKLLTDAMGGTIEVESEQGVGSKFTVTIPSEISNIPEYMRLNVESEDKKPVAATPAKKQLKILVAEDNDLNAEILLEILSDAGFEAAHARDGSEAVKMFEESAENEYCVILMDMQMPVMDGCAAAEKIRSLERSDARTIPIFACTANTFKEDRVKAYNSGMNDFLTKPIDVKVLLQKMETVGKDTDGKFIEE